MKNTLFGKILLFFVLWVSLSFAILAKDASFYASNSVLNSGNWYKIRVDSDGIYKLTYDDILKMGISNPSHVQIWGYGGWMLDEDFSSTYSDDLPQVAVWMNKGADGVFNQGDYLLFYARGSVKWVRSDGEFVQTNNPYSNSGYYFVTEGTAGPMLMDSISEVDTPSVDVTSFSDYQIHEKNKVNILQSGREFYGENFTTNNSQDFNFTVPGIVSWLGYGFNFVAKPSSSVNLSVRLNNTLLYSRSIAANTNTYSSATSIVQYLGGASTAVENNVFNITLGSTSIPNSYLNYLRVYFKRKLQSYAAVTFFRNDIDSLSERYIVDNATQDMLVFDVTGNTTPLVCPTSYSGTQLTFSNDASTQHEYALVDLSKDIPKPDVVGSVSNQNLHGLSAYNLIIIAPKAYQTYAQQIADLHTQYDGLTVLVVDPVEIYNEFSSGTPDATAYRRFLKMFYDRGTGDVDRLQYLLLFGDGTYNNKFIDSQLTEEQKSNYLLTYQSTNSLSLTSSYVTDDYFGFLQEDGALTIVSAKLCLGIGRLPARDANDAQVYVDKISAYLKDESPGLWENNICFLADDAVGGSGYLPATEMYHEKQSDSYASYVEEKYPSFNVNKIYEDSYKRVSQTNGYRYPEAQADLIDKLTQGQLLLNYVGHGSSSSWTHEYIMKKKDFQSLENKHLPLWITATCDFSCFDADETSGGEVVLNNSKGGAIALLSTVRTVYIANNDSMSSKVYKCIFERDNGKALRFGDIVRKSKLLFTVDDDNKIKFQLLGDPALRLSYPDDTYHVKLTSINDQDVSDADTIQFSALSKVQIDGQIVDQNNNLVSDFNGKLSSLIQDALQDLQTRDNGGDGSVFKYKDYLNSIYSGTVDIQNGSFTIEFVVPKDIMYTNGHGKMSFYAWEEAGRKAQGYFSKYKVFGTNSAAQVDNSSPVIRSLFLNSSDFVSGGTVNTTPTLHAQLDDDNGINLSTGLGHTINLILDGTTEYELTSNFVSSDNSSKTGSVDFMFPELTEGEHVLKLTAWDIYNNHVDSTLTFVVKDNNKSYLYNVTVEPEAVKSSANFLFSTDAVSTSVSLLYKVYSNDGELVWTHKLTGSSESASGYSCSWNLKKSTGEIVAPGIYKCKATVLINGREQNTKEIKFVVLAQ